MRLLLVEDDVTVASGIKLGLADAGYAVDWVGSGERAQEVLRTESFDAAIIDIGLPAMAELAVHTGRCAGPSSRWWTWRMPWRPVAYTTGRPASPGGGLGHDGARRRVCTAVAEF